MFLYTTLKDKTNPYLLSQDIYVYRSKIVYYVLAEVSFVDQIALEGYMPAQVLDQN